MKFYNPVYQKTLYTGEVYRAIIYVGQVASTIATIKDFNPVDKSITVVINIAGEDVPIQVDYGGVSPTHWRVLFGERPLYTNLRYKETVIIYF